MCLRVSGYVKVCGITHADDARLALDAGVDALGVNLVPGTPRAVRWEEARALARFVGAEAEVVGVVAGLARAEAERLVAETGLRWLQLHGEESTEEVRALGEALAPLGARVFKAVRVAGVEDVELARAMPGERVLTDSKVSESRGGTGQRFDWQLVTTLAAERPLILAGGLDADNVAEALEAVRPWGCDAASGVERQGEPRRKAPDRLRAFVSAARAAFGRLARND